MRRSGSVAFAVALAACLAGAGCDDLGPEKSELERNRALWSSVRPSGYRYAVERLCFCGLESRGPVRVTVDGNAVRDRVYVGSGQAVPGSAADLFPAVDGLFEVLEDAFARDAHEVDVTYDPSTGVPVEFWIDYQEMVADEELGMSVTESVEATPIP